MEKERSQQTEAPLVHRGETDCLRLRFSLPIFKQIEPNLVAAIIFHPSFRMITIC